MRLAPALLVLVALLAGCDLAKTCNCLGPDGPAVDFTAHTGDIVDLVGGTTTGTVADDPGDERDGVHFDACAIAGETFTLALDVGDPTDCDDADEDTPAADCSAALEASWPVSGTLQIGEDEAIALDGRITIWSTEEGLLIFKPELDPPAADYPHQTLDVLFDGTLLGDATFTGLSWGRRLSDDDATTTVWEVCALPA